MLSLPAPFLEKLQAAEASLTVCWSVVKTNGDVLRGTAHDNDVAITSGPFQGVYRSRLSITASHVVLGSAGEVGNLEVEGAFFADLPDFSIEELEAGLYDRAPSTLILLNWQDPDAGQKVLLHGSLGEFTRDSDGHYRAEVRGLTQALAQQIIRTYSERCNVSQFGDDRCKFDVEAATRTGTVTAVTDRKNFTVDLDEGADPVGEPDLYYAGGKLVFTSGANETFAREARSVVFASPDVVTVVLWDEAAADIAPGDTITLAPGCDRRYETCRDVHDNLLNFRGFGVLAPGRDVLLRGPT